MLVVGIEDFEPFTSQCSIQHCQRSGPLRTFMRGVALVHERLDHLGEGFGRNVRFRLGLCENVLEAISDPVVTRSARMDVVGVAILKALRQPAAAALAVTRSAEHTSELQSLMPISYSVFS